MKAKLDSSSDRLFSKLLVCITFSVVFTIIIVSTILCFYYRNIQLSQINSSSRDTLSQVGYSADFMVESTRSLVAQMINDPNIVAVMYTSSVDFTDLSKASQKLFTYGASLPFIQSIYVYNRLTDNFFTNLSSLGIKDSSDFYDQDIVKYLKEGNISAPFTPITRRIALPGSNEDIKQVSNVFTFVFTNSQSNSKSSSAIIINVSELWMRKVMTSLDISAMGNILIVDGSGKIASSMYKDDMLTDVSKEEYIRKVLSLTQPSGYFIENIKGIKTLVVYVSNKKLNWNFVCTIPYSTILSKINSMTRNTVIICTAILCIGLLLSTIMSRRIYRPINDIISKARQLSAESRKNSFQLKQEFLRNTILNPVPCSKQNILKSFSKHEIKLDIDKPVIAVLLRIDCFTDFCQRYGYNDRSLIKFGILNIASELSDANFANEVVDVGEDHVVILLNVTEAYCEDMEKALKVLSANIQSNVLKCLEVSVSCTFTGEAASFDGVNSLYNRVHDGADYRVFYGHQCVIDSDKLDINSAYEYPFNKEKQLTSSLISCDIEGVKRVFTEIINPSLAGYPISAFNTTILRLTFSINMAVDGLSKSAGMQIDLNFNGFISELNSLETLQDITEHFFKMFEFIASRLEEKRSRKYDELVNRVIEIIASRYADPNLCLESIADAVNMSATYLGRIFKKYTLKSSVSDYINEVRMQKAMSLLVTSDFPINEIADKTGFSSSNYFHAVFKKTHGITPNEYRMNSNC